MKKTLKKTLLFILGSAFIFLSIFFGEFEFSKDAKVLDSETGLRVHFLDVGQGDAILIQTPEGKDILIDGGPDDSVIFELGRIMPVYDHSIDIMILTHPHADHLSGLIDVLKKYQIGQIYTSGVLHTLPDYSDWLQEVRDQQITTTIIKDFKRLNLEDDLYLDFLYPNRDFSFQRVKELNNTSLVTRLIYGETSFLFMGDAEKEVEIELLELNLNLRSDVLKLGHHGSNSSSTIEFLESVNPEMAIAQCGLDNQFRHPHTRVVNRLNRLGIKLFRTDYDSTITIISDGSSIFPIGVD